MSVIINYTNLIQTSKMNHARGSLSRRYSRFGALGFTYYAAYSQKPDYYPYSLPKGFGIWSLSAIHLYRFEEL